MGLRKGQITYNSFKPGNTFGKRSNRKLSAEHKAVKLASQDDLIRCWDIVRRMNVAQLKEVMNAEKAIGLFAVMCSAYLHAIKYGDFSKLERILDRVIGKVKIAVDVEGNLDVTLREAPVIKDSDITKFMKLVNAHKRSKK